MQTEYSVYFKPLVAAGVWLDEWVNVSQYIQEKDLSNIEVDLEGDDFHVGLFKSKKTVVKLRNVTYIGTIFPRGYNRCKVRIDYRADNQTVTAFTGYIKTNSSDTKETATSIQFKVRGNESALGFQTVPVGYLAGQTCEQAIKKLLSSPALVNYFNYTADNVTLGYNPYIDNGAAFDNLSFTVAMRELLLVSNSVLSVDNDNNVMVSTREPRGTTKAFYGNTPDRDNILQMKQYKDGLQRTFNQIAIKHGDNQEMFINDADSITDYDLQKLDIEIKSITDTYVLEAVAQNLLANFAQPKHEVDLVLDSSKLIPRLTELQECTLELWEQAQYPRDATVWLWDDGKEWDNNAYYPHLTGIFTSNASTTYKVIKIQEQCKTGTTTITLRAA
jgi:hypothetical protein